jgi:CubicO group peptidase (beta-lactamase class C family)
VCAALAGVSTKPQSPQTAAPPSAAGADLETVVAGIVKRFSAPGVAIAIVKDGQTLLTRGYGVRGTRDRAAVDEHTLFYTASVTKAFTVTALGMLADEGKFKIDGEIASYLPEFALADRALRDTLPVRDLMSHRTGLPRADLLLVSGKSNADIVRGLGALAPQAPVRSRFIYQNQMYLVLGVLLERLSGTTWTRFLEERLLAPVGFVDGNAAGLGHWGNRAAASPHARTPTGVAAIDLVPRDPYGAGGINASAVDLAAWMKFQLGDGTVSGRRLVNANVLAAEHTPNILVPGNVSMPSAVMNAYGLGWFIHDYFGHRVVQHGGNGEGWTSLVLLVPQQRIGVAVLTNVHQSAAPTAIAYTVIDRLLGRTAHDYTSEYAEIETRRTTPVLAAPAAPLTAAGADAVGDYEHPLYGRAALSMERGGLVFTYGTLSGVVVDTTVTWTRSDMAAVLGAGRLSLRTEADAKRLVLETAGERFEFTRVR